MAALHGEAAASPLLLSALPADLVLRILAPETPGELLRLCSVSAAFRGALGTPSERNRGSLAWRRLFDRLDPGAVLLRRDAEPHSCDGYVEHALRLSGADGRQPGLLKLAHALAKNACTSCGEVTRLVAWHEHGGPTDGLQRCCSGCPLPGLPGSGPKTEATIINEFLFLREPVAVIDATVLPRDTARMRLHVVVINAVDGDTIALCGEFRFDGDMDGPFGTFAAAMGAAIRLVGLPRPPHIRPPPPPAISIRGANIRAHYLAAEAALGAQPFTKIHVSFNCIELYAPGALLENLTLSSGERYEVEGRPFAGFSAAYAIAAKREECATPTYIFKRCWLHGLMGSSLVMGVGARCALLQSVCDDTNFFQVHAEEATVLRISGCHLLDTMMGKLLSLTGQPSEAAMRAVAASNVLHAGENQQLLDIHNQAQTGGMPATLLLA